MTNDDFCGNFFKKCTCNECLPCARINSSKRCSFGSLRHQKNKRPDILTTMISSSSSQSSLMSPQSGGRVGGFSRRSRAQGGGQFRCSPDASRRCRCIAHSVRAPSRRRRRVVLWRISEIIINIVVVDGKQTEEEEEEEKTPSSPTRTLLLRSCWCKKVGR